VSVPAPFLCFAKRGRDLAVLLARRMLGWVPRIAAGPGKGLRFDAGPATAMFVSGDYEVAVQNAFVSLLREGDVFYDIGANVGFFSVLAGRLVGQAGAVHAFEPVPANASMVERNAQLNHLGNIEVFRVAVSNQTGKSELYLADHAGGAALKSAGVPPDLAGVIVVDTSSIDDHVNLRRMRPPNVVKIDVEGAELEVLHGMLEVLQEWSPKIILEVDDAERKRCEEKMTACKEFLTNLRYRIEGLPKSYKDGRWFVRHLVARHESPLRSSDVTPAMNSLKS
jgi:FkbM family methyltransferase